MHNSLRYRASQVITDVGGYPGRPAAEFDRFNPKKGRRITAYADPDSYDPPGSQQ